MIGDGVSKILESTHDASIGMLGGISSNSTNKSTEELDGLTRSWLIYCLTLAAIGATVIYFDSLYLASSIVFCLYGGRALLNGNILIQPENTGFSIFFGIKSRIIGGIFFALGVVLFFIK